MQRDQNQNADSKMPMAQKIDFQIREPGQWGAELKKDPIPASCCHSDVLKYILVNCRELSFIRVYKRVEAHQDKDNEWDKMKREAQLNTICDGGAKRRIYSIEDIENERQEPFPLEHVYVDGAKMTSDTGTEIRYATHQVLAKELFHDQKALTSKQCEEVSWRDL